MKIKKEKQVHEHTTYLHEWRFKENPGAGFSFDCDENGYIDVAAMNPGARHNYLNMDRSAMYDMGIVKYDHRWVEPAIGECEDCGDDVELGHFTCTCEKCGADYNWNGWRLAPREQWGEETGESASDILNIK